MPCLGCRGEDGENGVTEPGGGGLAAENYRLRLPGPTAVPERVRAASAQPVLNHRGPEFRRQLGQAEALLQPLMGTSNPILFFGSSGTGMMEAALVNLLAPGERVLCLSGGQFGERFAAIGRALGAEVDLLESEWGEAVPPEAVAERLRQRDYRAVTVVQNESTTGVVSDIAAIGALLRGRLELLVVDTVSGLAGLPVRMDEWGVDVLLSASQKGLMCPPGLAVASLSEKARAAIQREGGAPRFYFDFRRALDNAAKQETPFTPPTGLVAGLLEALGMIHAEGLPAVFARHRRLSGAMLAGAAAIGLAEFPRSPLRSPTVAVLSMPAGIEGGAVVRGLYDRYRTVIAGARNRLAGKVIRIGTMGHLGEGDILTDLQQLEQVLASLGHKLQPGAAVAAAAHYLAKH